VRYSIASFAGSIIRCGRPAATPVRPFSIFLSALAPAESRIWRTVACGQDASQHLGIASVACRLIPCAAPLWFGFVPVQDYKKVLMNAFERLKQIIQALNEENVDYVLFGGQAVNLHGILRFTEDIDLFVSPTPENVHRLRQALRRIWQDPAIEEILVEDLAGEYAVVRYGTPDGFYIDLVSRLGEAFRFEDIESQALTMGDTRIKIATPRMLYRMKSQTIRPIDRADALDLRAKFHFEDE
jgi:Nucleotidyl transferase AbiEii toxin, Type IV TA system